MRDVLSRSRFAPSGLRSTKKRGRRNGNEFVIALAARCCSLHLPASAQQLIPFRVGITDAVNTVLPVWMAQEGGFYAANGLKVEIINMGGGTRGAKELQAGNIDLMRVGMSSVVQANRRGGDLRLIGSMSNVIRFVIATAPGVKSAADLKGGVIGVSSIGSESDSTVTLALERFGMTRADVTVKEYGGGAKRLAAVRAGEIKATAINEPTTSQAREQGVNILIDLAAEKIPWLFSGVVVRRGDLKERRDLAMRFLRAVIEGNYLALTDAARAKAVLARELNVKNPKIVDISYEDFRAQSPPDMDISMPGVENVLKISAGSGSRNPADYIDGGVLMSCARAASSPRCRRNTGSCEPAWSEAKCGTVLPGFRFAPSGLRVSPLGGKQDENKIIRRGGCTCRLHPPPSRRHPPRCASAPPAPPTPCWRSGWRTTPASTPSTTSRSR